MNIEGLNDHEIMTTHDRYVCVVIIQDGQPVISIDLEGKARGEEAVAELIETMGHRGWYPVPPHDLKENPGLLFRFQRAA